MRRFDSELRLRPTRARITSDDSSIWSEEETTMPTSETSIFEHEYKAKDTKNTCNKWGFVVDPEGDRCYLWLGVVTVSVLYNYWTIAFRAAFDISDHWLWCWFDPVADIIYLVDVVVQFHVGYLEQGILVQDTQKLRTHYRQTPDFIKDIISIFPIAVYILKLMGCSYSGVPLVVYRFPCLLKISSFFKFFEMSDTHTNLPHVVRGLKLALMLGTAFHSFACFCYIISVREVFGKAALDYLSLNQNATLTRKYIKCLHWAILVLTASGQILAPETNLEYAFTAFTVLLGVTSFARWVGSVADVIRSRNAPRREFAVRMDGIKQYMKHRNVPESLQRHVKKWLNYSWMKTQTVDEASLLAWLPSQLRSEIAMHLHLNTLKKVDIFANCEDVFLRELVVKMTSQIFSPGDYICRTGEEEMFFINTGYIEVLIDYPQSDGRKILVKTLTEGDYVGEISLLKLDGGCNRRSADVRSIGFSEVSILSKRDLKYVLENFPEVESTLRKIGRERLQDQRIRRSIGTCLVEETDFKIEENETWTLCDDTTRLQATDEEELSIVESDFPVVFKDEFLPQRMAQVKELTPPPSANSFFKAFPSTAV